MALRRSAADHRRAVRAGDAVRIIAAATPAEG